MRRPEVLRIAVFLLVGAALSLGAPLLYRGFAVPPPVCPAVVKIEAVEPIEMANDAGAEMVMLSLSISNSVLWPNERSYVNDSGVSLSAKVANRWVPLDGKIGFHGVWPGYGKQVVIVVPANATDCRFKLKWAYARLTGGWMRRIAEQGWLPGAISGRLWRLGWGGFPRWVPSAVWREITIELPIVGGNLHGEA